MNIAFRRPLPSRALGALTGLLCVVAWTAGRATAQTAGGSATPPTAGASLGAPQGGGLGIEGLGIEGEVPATEDYEVLARGPIHEAFAQPSERDAQAVLIAPEPPPPAVQEQPPETRPTGNNVIWIPGYWSWDDLEAEYIYVSGLWRDVPPGRRWTPGYWHQVDSGYQWQSGFWISETQEEVTYLPAPPETLEVGPNIDPPADDYFWIPGCWQYAQADYTWRPGFWSPIQSGWIWVPAHYVPTAYGYVYVDGYWDYEPGHRGLAYASVVFRRPVYLSPNYYYRPAYALGNPAALLVHLFLRPSYGMYYYGDYYSPYFYGLGYQPWYAPIGGSYYYNPAVSYYRWKYARYGVDFHDRMHLWKRRYERHHDHHGGHGHDHGDHDRGRRYYEPRQRASIASGVASPSGSDQLELISSMDELARERRSRYTQVEPSQRQRYEDLSREIRSVADLRQRQDREDLRLGRSAGDRRERPELGSGDLDSRRGSGRPNFRLPDSYRMGRPSLDVETRDRGRDGQRGRPPVLTDRGLEGRAGRGSEGGRPDADSRRPGSGMLVPGGSLQTPDLDLRRSDRDSRGPSRELRVPDPDSRSPGSRLEIPGRDSRSPGSRLEIPAPDLRGPGSGLRVPSGEPRGRSGGLRIPGGDSPGRSGGIRIPGGESVLPGSSLRIPRSSGRPEGGMNLRPNIERGPSGFPGGGRSGGFNSRSERGPTMQSPRSISPGRELRGSPRSFGPRDSGGGEWQGRGSRGGDGYRGGGDRGGGGNRGGGERGGGDRGRGRGR